MLSVCLALVDLTLKKRLVCLFVLVVRSYPGFPGGSVVKNLPANAGDAGWTPASGRSPGEGNNNTLQYSCLGNPLDREAWWATVHKVMKESDTTWRLNNNNNFFKDIMLLHTQQTTI